MFALQEHPAGDPVTESISPTSLKPVPLVYVTGRIGLDVVDRTLHATA
jgi:hypothetical protein